MTPYSSAEGMITLIVEELKELLNTPKKSGIPDILRQLAENIRNLWY